MTNEQLAEIEKLHAAATPGEWKGDRLDGTVKYRLQSEDCDCDIDEPWNCPHLVLDVDHKNRTSGFLGKYSSENEELVIVLHNAFPALADALREAREDARKHREDALAWMQVSFADQKERDEARAEVARMKARPAETEYLRLDGMWQQLVRERDEARAEVERLKESVANLDVLYVSRTDALRESEAEVERLRGIVEVNDRRLAVVWDEARAEVEREKASATRGWQTADELHLTVRDLKAEVERLRGIVEVNESIQRPK